MRKKLYFLSLLLLPACLFAQYNLKENNVWAFGQRAGLDFKAGSPVAIKTEMNTTESCASICDKDGKLLFYTTGDTVWNKNHEVMPHGGLVLNNKQPAAFYNSLSTTQGALIVPVLDNPSQYYLFSLQDAAPFFTFQDIFAGRLYYSRIDMSLDNGNGDVVSDQKAIPLDSGLSEKMIAIPGDDCNIWVLVHGNSNNIFKAYEINAAGINPVPVESTIGNLSGYLAYGLGALKIAPNRRKLGAVSFSPIDLTASGSELYDFDPATGKVSNCITLNSGTLQYGASFSPDNSKFYTMTSSDAEPFACLWQFDLSLPTAADIINSKQPLDTFYTLNAFLGFSMRLAPDGKIYFGGHPDNQSIEPDTIFQIEFPDQAGLSCNPHYALSLLEGTSNSFGSLPGEYLQPQQDVVSARIDTTLTAATPLKLAIEGNYFTYLWNDGSTDSTKTITEPGTYWVTYTNYCIKRTDTFEVGWPVSIAALTAAESPITVSPNPASDFITVNISTQQQVNGTVQIIDASGRVVWEQPLSNNNQTFSLSALSNGLYTLQYHHKDKSARKAVTNLIINNQ